MGIGQGYIGAVDNTGNHHTGTRILINDSASEIKGFHLWSERERSLKVEEGVLSNSVNNGVDELVKFIYVKNW